MTYEPTVAPSCTVAVAFSTPCYAAQCLAARHSDGLVLGTGTAATIVSTGGHRGVLRGCVPEVLA